MIKAILFDLDGTLVDAKDWHYEALNLALKPYNCLISRDEHLSRYDGLSTRTKLKILSDEKDLPVEAHDEIYNQKQRYTKELIKQKCKPNNLVCQTLEWLKRDGYTLVCCSNAIRESVKSMLEKANIIQYFDFYLSNQDVFNTKPHPEIYLRALKKLKIKPEEALAIEDNEQGIKSVLGANINLLRVFNTNDVTFKNIIQKVENLDHSIDCDINIVIPMAGDGRRFQIAGYKKPKPFIDVNGKTMIERVLDNLYMPNARFILIARKSHMLDEPEAVARISNKYNVIFIPIDKKTEGSACTVLFARKYINNDIPLILANADQLIDINIKNFIKRTKVRVLDGNIITFYDDGSNPKWSYTEIDKNGLVKRTEEKVAISTQATVGIYYFAHGKDYVDGALDMIVNNDRIKNEFYNCPIYNYLIREKKSIGIYEIERKQMHGLGTPEDLEKYLKEIK